MSDVIELYKQALQENRELFRHILNEFGDQASIAQACVWGIDVCNQAGLPDYSKEE